MNMIACSIIHTNTPVGIDLAATTVNASGLDKCCVTTGPGFVLANILSLTVQGPSGLVAFATAIFPFPQQLIEYNNHSPFGPR